MDEKTIARFWSKVEKTDTCWLWRGNRLRAGYGRFWLGERTLMAHRVSWRIASGRDPGPLFVLHKCDNPPCVNPSHLFLGTQLDNMADKVLKCRQVRGEMRANAIWRESDVIRLRELVAGGSSIAAAARLMGMKYALAKGIIQRRLWSHVP